MFQHWGCPLSGLTALLTLLGTHASPTPSQVPLRAPPLPQPSPHSLGLLFCSASAQVPHVSPVLPIPVLAAELCPCSFHTWRLGILHRSLKWQAHRIPSPSSGPPPLACVVWARPPPQLWGIELSPPYNSTACPRDTSIKWRLSILPLLPSLPFSGLRGAPSPLPSSVAHFLNAKPQLPDSACWTSRVQVLII